MFGLFYFITFYIICVAVHLTSRSQSSSQQMNLMEWGNNYDAKTAYKRREHCEGWKGDMRSGQR